MYFFACNYQIRVKNNAESIVSYQKHYRNSVKIDMYKPSNKIISSQPRYHVAGEAEYQLG